MTGILNLGILGTLDNLGIFYITREITLKQAVGFNLISTIEGNTYGIASN